MAYRLSEVNQMTQADFVAALGAIFEQTPAIAAAVWAKRPFASRDRLYDGLAACVAAMSPEEQLALLRAHPDLGSQARMAAASVQEQAGAGLDCLTPEEFAQFQALNRAYRDRFGFPFLLAVKGLDQQRILAAFQARLLNDPAEERDRALAEVLTIARHRLAAVVADDEPAVDAAPAS